MRTPRVLQITASSVISQSEVLARLERVASFSPERRAGFAVQLRDPELSARELLTFGRLLRERTQALGAQLVVNDRLDIAELLGADAVHLGRHSVLPEVVRERLGSKVWISRSCHDEEDLSFCRDTGVDIAILCPMFPSPGKAMTLGLKRLEQAVKARSPGGPQLMALGGLDLARAADCLAAGAAGVAAIRADLTSLL